VLRTHGRTSDEYCCAVSENCTREPNLPVYLSMASAVLGTCSKCHTFSLRELRITYHHLDVVEELRRGAARVPLGVLTIVHNKAAKKIWVAK
jgi:hypothetical protein